MEPGFIVIETSPERDPDRSRLRDVLRAQAGIERAQLLRDIVVHWLALLSLPLGVIVAVPVAAAVWRSLTFVAWMAGVGGLVVAGLSEWTYRRARASRMVELGSPPRAR